MKRLISALAAVTLLATACGSGADSSNTTNIPNTSTTVPDGTTTSITTTTTTTTLPPEDDWCAPGSSVGERHAVDLDGEGLDEWVRFVQSAAHEDGTATYLLGVCADHELAAGLEMEGEDLAVLGFVDLDDDGTKEILLRGANDRGTVVQAATLTLRGLVLTDVAVEKWIEADPPSNPFHGAGLECADVDDDGDIELLTLAIWPANDLLNDDDGVGEDMVHVEISVVGLEGTTSVLYGIDAFENAFTEVYARWSDSDRCAPGSPPRVEVRFGDNGWGKVEFDPANFASDGDVVLTGVARGGTEDRYVTVGVEAPSFFLGEFFPPRPVVWSSTDGLTWDRSDLGEVSGELRDVVALSDGSGFVAVGRTGSLTAAAWLSSDGRVWDLVEIPAARPGTEYDGPVMSQIIETPFGLVGVGVEDYIPDPGGPSEDFDAAVWLSPGGRSWERIESPALGTAGYQPNSAGEFNAELFGVAYHPSIGLVAVGYASEENPATDYPDHHPAVWVSEDGRSWQRHALDRDVRLRGITATGDGLIVFGLTDRHGSPTSDAVVLFSRDGEEWNSVSGDFHGVGEVDGIQSINEIVAVPGAGFVALGSDEKEFESIGGAATWWSDGSDVMRWERELHDDDVFTVLTEAPTATMTDAVWSDDILLAVGFTGRWTDPPHGFGGCCIAGPAIWMWTSH